jgi:phosphorylase kinase alpha/beta subunit
METERLRTTLDGYYRQIERVVLSKQHPVTGLLPASTAVTHHGNYQDAWVRDNVYSILCVWGLALAYERLDDNDGRGYELRQRTAALMRGLLRSMMTQAHKVEAFKYSRSPEDALHAKYDTETGAVVVGDHEWGHLQIDATSLYLLTLTQMISSGLDLIWTQDEVSFVQNLVYYVERAYRTPDYGIWERGDKLNRGSVELNSSSIGLAKAALEALAGFDLFGTRGSQRSVIHVVPDNVAQANVTLASMLPRESNTKETDAALLSVIGFPAFAVQDDALRNRVRLEVVSKLEGRYGLKRFLRDGHQNVLEEKQRLHYEPEELKRFENVESEWPLFFAYLFLDHLFRGELEQADSYARRLEELMLERDGERLLPELYYVPKESIAAERACPGSQQRVPNDNVPLVWAQSLYLLGRMIRDGLLTLGDVDPLSRRHHRSPRRPVVQIALLVEDADLQAELAEHGVRAETMEDIKPIQVYLSAQIAAAHGQVGRNARLGLTGRAARQLKTLTTSRLYRLGGQTAVCLASFLTQQEFYLAYDLELLLRRFRSELHYLHNNWNQPGRPTVTVLLTRDLLQADRTSFYELVQQIEAGRVDNIPVARHRLAKLIPTAAFERIDELYDLALPADPARALIKRSHVLAEPGQQTPLASSEELAIETTGDGARLVERLEQTDNLYEQIELISALVRLGSLHAKVTVGGTPRRLRDLASEVYEHSGRLRLWAVVRQAAGLLGKVDGDLNLAVGSILTRQKSIQVGRAYSDASLISHPLPDQELIDKINAFCRDDVRDRVLTQEILLYLALLIKERPALFSELLTLRVGQLISLLTSEIVREQGVTPEQAYEELMQLAPSTIQARLEAVISEYESLASLPQRLEQLHTDEAHGTLDWSEDLGLHSLRRPTDGWLVWRQRQGVLDRRPAHFYGNVWNIFNHASSVVIGDRMERRNRMESSVVLSDMTAGEKAFALWIEHLLNKIQAPEYRQLNVEALQVMASFFRQNPSLKIHDALALDVLLGHAVRIAYVEQRPEHDIAYDAHKSAAWSAFYASPPVRTSACLVAALRSLLLVRAA